MIIKHASSQYILIVLKYSVVTIRAVPEKPKNMQKIYKSTNNNNNNNNA